MSLDLASFSLNHEIRTLSKLATDLELKVTLYETPRNFVEYAGE